MRRTMGADGRTARWVALRLWLWAPLASLLLVGLLAAVARTSALPARVHAAAASTPACPGPHQPPLYTAIYGAQVPGQAGHPLDEVALTFDDGPTPYSSPAIISYLEQTHTPATFFVLGQYVHLWPYLVQREWSDGFAIGIHTWDHPDMTTLSQAKQDQQLSDTIDALHQALGQDACFWFWRPPYGSYNSTVLQTARSFGLTTIMWNVDPADWSRPGTQTIATRVLAQVAPASIILMHDGPALREQTAAALPIILAGLRARGLKPVTIPQLLADEQYPGVIVRHAVLAPGAVAHPDVTPGALPFCDEPPPGATAGTPPLSTPVAGVRLASRSTLDAALVPACVSVATAGP